MKTNRTRRQPKTARGGDVRDKVAAAATDVLAEEWIDQVSIARLAREAGVVRASLLLQFPRGWPDVALEVYIRQLVDLDRTIWDLESASERPPQGRLFELLDTVLQRAEQAGLLYPNLRSQMFTWGDENDMMEECEFSDLYDGMSSMISQALLIDRLDNQTASNAAQSLFELTLDLAARSQEAMGPFERRREMLRMMIDATIDGLRKLKSSG